MDLKDRTVALAEGAKSRRTEKRNDRMERDIEHLRVENETLKEEIDRDRDRLSKALDSLEKTSAKATAKPHRIRRLFALTAAAGGAYVVGAKAGRERYEQIRGWWSQMRDRSPVSDVHDAGQEWVDKATDKIEEKTTEAG